MEDELQKRNTDCVYFLASPLTCKKGSECEYRHSETARLNPRDCWYWLNSNCLNPSCAFRHPPLEGLPETKPETAANLPTYAAAASKSSVPCYFYFNAYCIKGDQCPFMHDTFPSQKSSKVAPEITTTHPPENKGPSGSDTGPATVEVPPNLSGDNFELTKQEPLFKEPTRQPATDTALEEASPSAESSEPFIKLPEENLASPREYMNGSSQVSPDHQCSEEILKECDNPDEWWESSPGFDVLVDDGSEQLPYEEDGDYQLPQEREPDMLHRRLLQFDYEVPPGYDPLGFPDASYLYEHGMYDGYDRVDNRHAPGEHFHRASENSTERRRRRESDPPSHRKRKPSRRRHEAVDCGGGCGSGEGRRDLRDHLRKQRRVEGGGSSGGGSKRYRSRSRGGSRERSWSTRGMGPSIHSRLVSEMVDSHVLLPIRSEGDRPSDHFLGRGWSGYPESIRHARSRLRERDSRRNRKLPPRALSSEISDGTDHTTRKESSVSTKFAAAFSGPKTLAQIKEEKRRAMAVDGSNCSESHALQNPRRRQQHGGGDFEGPKPLSELLKDKRRCVEGNGHANVSASMASEEDHQTGSCPGNRLSTFRSGIDYNGMDHGGTVGNKNSGYESDFVDDDDDDDDDDYDEDALREKLVKILSS